MPNIDALMQVLLCNCEQIGHVYAYMHAWYSSHSRQLT